MSCINCMCETCYEGEGESVTEVTMESVHGDVVNVHIENLTVIVNEEPAEQIVEIPVPWGDML